MNVEQRFWAKVEVRGDCWVWTASMRRGGYGQFGAISRATPVTSHKWAWERYVGEWPAGLVADHLCRNRACVRWDHIEPVTNAENVLRGEHPNIRAYRAGTCTKGHSTVNSTIRRADGRPQCGMCHNDRRRAAYRQPKLREFGRAVRQLSFDEAGDL